MTTPPNNPTIMLPHHLNLPKTPMPWMLMSYISPRWPHKNENIALKMVSASAATNLGILAQPALPSPLTQRNATLRERSRRWSMKTSQSLKKLRVMMTKKPLEGFPSPPWIFRREASFNARTSHFLYLCCNCKI